MYRCEFPYKRNAELPQWTLYCKSIISVSHVSLNQNILPPISAGWAGGTKHLDIDWLTSWQRGSWELTEYQTTHQHVLAGAGKCFLSLMMFINSHCLSIWMSLTNIFFESQQHFVNKQPGQRTPDLISQPHHDKKHYHPENLHSFARCGILFAYTQWPPPQNIDKDDKGISKSRSTSKYRETLI